MPEEKKNAEVETIFDLFKIEFVMLPHKHYETDKFEEKAKQLKARFKLDAPNTLFLSDAEQKNLPIEDMP
jgi:hypothetical protein